MQRARFPARQLNSRTIKSTALGYLSSVFLGKCSILCMKCVCKVQEDGFEKGWINFVELEMPLTKKGVSFLMSKLFLVENDLFPRYKTMNNKTKEIELVRA